MKKKRKMSLLLIAVLLIGLLSGCTSAEKVLGKMVETMADKTLTHAKFSMPLSMNMKAAGEEASVDFELDGEFWLSEEPFAAYMEIKYEGDFIDQWLSDRIDMYMTQEDGNIVVYYYMKSADTWLRVDSGMTEETIVQSEEMNFTVSAEDIDLEALVMAEDTVSVGGSEAYEVSYTFAGQLLQDWWDEQGGFSGMLETAKETTELDEETAAILDTVDFSAFDELDLTVLSMPVTMYIDKSTYELKQVDMEYLGMDEMLNQIIGVLMDMVTQVSGLDAAALGIDANAISFDVPGVKLSLSDMSYEPVEVKAVPEEGIICGKQAAFEPLQEDGSYVLQESGNAVRVSPSEKKVIEYYDYCTLHLSYKNGAAETIYSMLGNDFTEEDLKDYVQSQVETFAQQGLEATVKDSEYEGYTIQAVTCAGYRIFHAWKQVGDGWIHVEAYNLHNIYENRVLWPALDIISDYTLS